MAGFAQVWVRRRSKERRSTKPKQPDLQKPVASPPADGRLCRKGDDTMFQTLLWRFHTWRQDRLAIHMLRQMDDRLLADMGAERACIEDFVHEHATRKAMTKETPGHEFFQIPDHRPLGHSS
jgi:uncharacterized protein YjiS (DUF1127 family)